MLRLRSSTLRSLRPLVPYTPMFVAVLLLTAMMAAALAAPVEPARAAGTRGPSVPARLSASTTLVLNEIDYDQPGTDFYEFIELKNVSSGSIDLNGWYVELVNGNGGAIYDTITLPSYSLPAGAHYLLCANPSVIVNCDLDISPPTSNKIQNGAPDAVGLRNPSGTLIDAVSYEGSVPGYVEGSGSGLADLTSETYGSISRYPDGVDTDVNNVDLSFRCSSPGQPNVSSSSNCPEPAQNTPTPLPTDTPTPEPEPTATPDDGQGGVSDLEIDKKVDPDPVVAGKTLAYSVSSINNGPDPAYDVEIVDDLPSSTKFVSAIPSGSGTCTTPAVGAFGGSVTCVWHEALAVGSNHSVLITVETCPDAACAEEALENTASTDFAEPGLLGAGLGALPLADSSVAGLLAADDIFISEYIEGSSNNKALEFYNATGAAVDLAAGGYRVEYYFNGGTNPGNTISLSGSIAEGDVFVLAHGSADSAILAVADQTNSGSWYNGDDAIVLRKGGAGGPIVDVIGQVGFDPGSGWGSGDISTRDRTLVRRPDVCAGDTDPSDDFEPNLDPATGEWDGYPQNTFTYIGSHTSECEGAAGPVDPNPDNNEITVTSGVTTQSDLRIAKSDDPDPVIAGESLTYVLTVTNDGPSNASGVQVVDTLPSYADYVSYSVEPAGPTCSEMGGIVTCDMGTMGAGEQCNTNYPSEYVITIETLVDPKTPCSAGQCPGSPAGPLVNEATVTVDNCEPDPDLSNNTVTEETEVLAGADVLIDSPAVFRPDGRLADEELVEGGACIGPGAILTVQQTFSNDGAQAYTTQYDNDGPEFEAQLPPQVVGKPGSCTVEEGTGSCVVTANRVTWNGEIPVGASVAIVYEVRVRGGTPVGTELKFSGRVNYDEYNIGDNTAHRDSEEVVAVLDCASVIDPNRQLGMQVHLPILDYLGNDDVCDTMIEIQALGEEPMKAVLVTWGEPGYCPPQAAGPLKVECTGLLKPGTTWIMYEDQIPTGAKGGMLFKFSTRQLSYYGLDTLFGFDDIFADLMCETLFFGVVGDADDYRRFKKAYNEGNVFAGIPLDLASGANEGGVLAVEVVRNCPGNTTAGVRAVSKYNGIAGSHLGTYDPVYGGYGYYVPLVYADKGGFESYMYIQNGGLECTSVEVWFKAQDDCLRARICDVATLAPGETYQLDASDCVGPQWQGSAWIRTSQPAGVAVDLIGTDVLMTYIGEPAELNYTFDPDQAAASPGNQVAFGPLLYSEYQGWDSGVQVMNLSPVHAAKVKAYFLDRSGDIITTLVDWICPRGSQTFFLPVIHDLPGNWVGSIRVESQEWVTPAGPLAQPPNIVGVATLVKYSDAQRTETREAIAYNLLPEHKVFDWQVGGLGAGGLEGGVGLIAIPSLMKDLDDIGYTSEFAVANVVPKPGFTDFAIYIFDQNGLLDYVCQKLNEKQVEYIDLQTWGYVNNSFKGSAIISAVYWEHEVFGPDGFFLRNLLGLAAVSVERSQTSLGTDIAGDESAGSRGIPFKQSDIEDEEFSFAFMADFPQCPGAPAKRKEQGKLRATDMFISEYVEGSSNNKALEFYNGTAATIDLAAGQYVVEVYFNGNFAPGSTINLTGSVDPGETWVLADDDASAALLQYADQTTAQFLFNGNDAVVLRKSGATGPILDVIGQVGFNPGIQWGSGLISTQNATLRRRPDIVAGDKDPNDDFEPNLDPASGQWDGYAQDTFDGLGWHITN